MSKRCWSGARREATLVEAWLATDDVRRIGELLSCLTFASKGMRPRVIPNVGPGRDVCWAVDGEWCRRCESAWQRKLRKVTSGGNPWVDLLEEEGCREELVASRSLLLG